MKLTTQQIHFIKQAVESVSVKATDAKFVSNVIEKVDKEFGRLAALDEKKQKESPSVKA